MRGVCAVNAHRNQFTRSRSVEPEYSAVIYSETLVEKPYQSLGKTTFPDHVHHGTEMLCKVRGCRSRYT
jgi:hypothetical protein